MRNLISGGDTIQDLNLDLGGDVIGHLKYLDIKASIISSRYGSNRTSISSLNPPHSILEPASIHWEGVPARTGVKYLNE